MKNLILILSCILFVACKTYTVAPESLKQQLQTNSSGSTAKINNPFSYYSTITYEANNLKWIKVINKKGQEETIQNSPSLEMKITTTNGKNYHMYFDTVFIRNDTLYAERSRLIGNLKRIIPFDSIQQIKIQEGGKNFQYQ